MPFRLFFVFIFFALAISPALAETRFLAVTGLIVEHPMGTSGESTGGAGRAGATFSQIGIGLQTPVSGKLFFQPTLSYTVPGRLLNDGAGRVNVWSLALPFTSTAAFFDFKIGPGILYYQIKGAGGSVDLPNESGGTTTYYRPADSVTSKVTFFDLGVGSTFAENFRFDFDIYINGILSLKRDFSLVTSLGYFFY